LVNGVALKDKKRRDHMKRLLLTLILVAVGLSGRAVCAQEQVVAVALAFQSTGSCTNMTISSQTPTAILASTATYRYRDVFLQNYNTDVSLVCGDNVNVSTLPYGAAGGTVNGNYGVLLSSNPPVGTSARVPLVPNQQWYCLNNSATKSVGLEVCPGR
jgi:hypothetical protein